MESVGNGKMIQLLINSNFAAVTNCTVGIPRGTFYTQCVDLSKVTSDTKRLQWCQFMGDLTEELSTEKNILEERMFYCRVDDYMIDIFTTDRNPADARHTFDCLRQATTEALADYLTRAVLLGRQASRPLFSDALVTVNSGEYLTNLTKVVSVFTMRMFASLCSNSYLNSWRECHPWALLRRDCS